MRLIDADTIVNYEVTGNFACGEFEGLTQFVLLPVEHLRDIDTAYDIDKVIEELEELKMRYFLTIANTGNEINDFAYEQVGNALDKAIEIVKQESMN